MAALLSVPIILVPAEWGAWIVFYAAFGMIPILISPLRRPRLFIAVLAVLAVHASVAIASAYGDGIFRDPDSKMFHNHAAFIALHGGFDFSPGANFYRSMLGLVYAAAAPSLLLGQATSCFATALSCIVLSRFMDLLKIERHQAPVILVFGLLPAFVLIGTSTMREAWQILFFMTAAYSLIRFRLKAEPLSLFLGGAASLALGFLHNGLLIFTLVMLPFVLFSRVGARAKLSLARLVGLVLTGLLLAGLGAAVALNKLPRSESLEAVSQGGGLEYAAQYREKGSKGARAEYGIKLDTGSPLAFVSSVGLLFVYYMLAPFPWQISTAVDLVGAADSWFRLIMIVFAVRAWRKRPPGAAASVERLLIGLYFMMSFLWALGTINYGTGIRHHIVGIWIPVLLGIPPLLDAFKRLSSPDTKAMKRPAS